MYVCQHGVSNVCVSRITRNFREEHSSAAAAGAAGRGWRRRRQGRGSTNEKFQARLGELFRIWNGFGVDIERGHIIIFTGGNKLDHDAVRSVFKRLSVCILAIFFRQRPPAPEVGKWTRKGPCFSWFASLMVCRLSHSYVDIGLKMFSSVDKSAGELAGDVQLDQEFNFAAVQGVRVASMRKLAHNEGSEVTMVMKALLEEPVSMLTSLGPCCIERMFTISQVATALSLS